jgi:hypothetical protein
LYLAQIEKLFIFFIAFEYFANIAEFNTLAQSMHISHIAPLFAKNP